MSQEEREVLLQKIAEANAKKRAREMELEEARKKIGRIRDDGTKGRKCQQDEVSVLGQYES
jgi:hypothetical protein